MKEREREGREGGQGGEGGEGGEGLNFPTGQPHKKRAVHVVLLRFVGQWRSDIGST